MSSTTYRSLTISAGDGKPCMGEDGNYRRRYVVTVKSDGTGVTRRFTFHDSIANHEAGKVGLSPDDLLEAFECFVRDADAGGMGWAEFAGDFGYDPDSYSGRQIWKSCRAARQKFYDLWHRGDMEPAEILEDLNL